MYQSNLTAHPQLIIRLCCILLFILSFLLNMFTNIKMSQAKGDRGTCLNKTIIYSNRYTDPNKQTNKQHKK